jgi:hypothetical protein
MKNTVNGNSIMMRSMCMQSMDMCFAALSSEEPFDLNFW